MDTFVYNYLSHHGIRGQKWGTRNGPPYPLGISNHSALERKAGWRKSLDKPDVNGHTKNNHSITEEKRGLSVKQKRTFKIGVEAAVMILDTHSKYRLAKSGNFNPLINKGKAALHDLLRKSKAGSADNVSQWKIGDLSKAEKVVLTVNGFKKLSKPETLSETLKNVNPHRGERFYKNNCTLCSIAVFLRQNGLDVTAGKTGGEQQILNGVVEECFKEAKTFDGSAVKFGKSRQDATEMLLKRFGNNAYGVCSIDWNPDNSLGFEGGHAFSWKIEDGVVSFFDGQANRDDVMVSKYWSKGLIYLHGSLQIARLDDVINTIDLDLMKKRGWLE